MIFNPSYYLALTLLFEFFFNIMVLMVVASCISGAASALTQYFGLNYYLGTFVIGLVVLFLTIFGVDLIRRASTYMGVVILVLAVSIYTVGLLNGHNLLDVMRVDFQYMDGVNFQKQLGTVLLIQLSNGLQYQLSWFVEQVF